MFVFRGMVLILVLAFVYILITRLAQLWSFVINVYCRYRHYRHFWPKIFCIVKQLSDQSSPLIFIYAPLDVCVCGWGDGGHMWVDCRLPIVQQVTDIGRTIIPYDLFVSSTTVLCFGLKTKSLRMFAPTVTAHPFCTSNIIHVGISCHVIHHTSYMDDKDKI